jgi:transposase
MGKSIRYPASYKADAVDLVRQRGKSIGQIARDLGIGDQTLRNWVAEAARDGNSGPSSDLNPTERDELKRLRRENATLLMERDILKKAAAFFAKEAR